MMIRTLDSKPVESAIYTGVQNVIWYPQEGPQTLSITCPVDDLLFGGSRGGGKSDFLLGDFLSHAIKSNGHARGILFRKTTPQLEEIIARSKEIYPLLGARWSAGTKTWIFPCGSTLKMRWLDRDADADNYQGHQYTWIGVDEAGTWSDPSPLDKLRATLRSAHGVRCVMRLTANPGGLGHQWINDRYIKPSPPKIPFYDEEKLTWRVYIPSRLTDNKKLIAADPGYFNRIKSSGPPWLVRAWLEGDWDASPGDNFFEERALKVDGKPVQHHSRCDYVFAVIDTAVKDGKEHDGTAVIYFSRNAIAGYPLIILDYDILQIQGAILEDWLPSVEKRLEQLAQLTNATYGIKGCAIEDKASGSILIQQAKRKGMNAHAIPAKYTAMGKEGRAMSVTGFVYDNQVKISEYAFNKVVTYKQQTRNHFLSQVCNFKIGQKDGPRDLLDCFCYGIQIALDGSIKNKE